MVSLYITPNSITSEVNSRKYKLIPKDITVRAWSVLWFYIHSWNKESIGNVRMTLKLDSQQMHMISGLLGHFAIKDLTLFPLHLLGMQHLAVTNDSQAGFFPLNVQHRTDRVVHYAMFWIYLHSSCKKLRRLSGHRSRFNCCIHPLLTLQAKSTSSIAWARICWRRHSKVTMAASLRMDRQVKKIHWSKDGYQTGYFYDKEINCW